MCQAVVVEAILLVGGKGTRLRPLTINTPKPMLPVGGVPFTSHQLAIARDAGVNRIVLGTSYRAEVFSDYFGDGSDFGLAIAYRVEDEPLGTGGGIRNAAEALTCGPDDPVIVFNGDVLSGVDLRGLVAAHVETNADVTLYLTRVEDPRAFGLVPTNEDGSVTSFLEKPTTDAEIVTNQINAGCYVFRRSVLDEIPVGRPVSVERETFPGLLAAGRRVTGYVDDGYWLDLGRPLDFVAGSADLVRGKIASSALPGPTGEYLALPGADIAGTADGGTVVGRNARIAAGAVVSGSVVMDDVEIAADAIVQNSVIGTGSKIGANCHIVDAVIAENVTLGANNELLTGARIWPDTQLGQTVVRFSSDG